MEKNGKNISREVIYNMKFIDKEHENFYNERLKEYGNADVYRKALIYSIRHL